MPHEHHIYERSKTNKEIYRCVDPDCTHYQKKEFLLGKRAKCFKCQELFILDSKQLKNFRPVCLNCSKSKKAARHVELKDTLLDLLNLPINDPEPVCPDKEF